MVAYLTQIINDRHDDNYQHQGEWAVAIKEKSNLEMGPKRMGHDRTHGVWRYHIRCLPIHGTSKYGLIQYPSANTTTLLALIVQ